MSDTWIYYADELHAPFALRVDVTRDDAFFRQLLDDEAIIVTQPFEPHGDYEYEGAITVEGRPITLVFVHKGMSNCHAISSLKATSPITEDEVRYIRQVMRENAREIPGACARHDQIKRQPAVLKIKTVRTGPCSSTGQRAYKDGPGYLGESSFVRYWQEHAPEWPLEWPNEERDAGLPFDVLIAGCLAVDVKATFREAAFIRLTPSECRFRNAHIQHHAIALVSLDLTGKCKFIDLYTGEALRKHALEDMKARLTQLPVLEWAGEENPSPKEEFECPTIRDSVPMVTIDSNTGVPSWFPLGTYAAEPDDGGQTLHFRADGTWSVPLHTALSESGSFFLRGRCVVLLDRATQTQASCAVLHGEGRVALRAVCANAGTRARPLWHLA
ncbi:hypothetical protein HNR42_002853 [Deinobacterium chartae]|uniref:Uncharacterized protein n=1 Tax=Deinobacterium chartae TaxID=521158 RepID=A0A841I675_9DEIO|nr:hypothetical protein [Deinobacterium chartae]MBB6099412.1 hypothetical protein [Deinobacterium chartae]